MTTEEILLQTIASLTKTNEEQGRQLSEQNSLIAELTAELKKMSAQIAWFQRQMFGRRSEKNISIDTQPGLFDAAELDTAQESSEITETEDVKVTEEETETYTRRKGTSKARETGDILPHSGCPSQIRTHRPD